MKQTNVFATDDEVKKLKELLHRAQTTPVIAFSSAHAMSGGASGDAWQRVKERCHGAALAHGLPEIPGFYGCDLETGEFVQS